MQFILNYLNHRVFRLCMVVVSLAVLQSGCSRPPEIQHLSGYAEGTTYHISWWSSEAVKQETLQTQFNTELAKIDEELSTYRDDSYISRFNHSDSTDWQAASADFIALINEAKTINQESHGCYDPTIGPLFDLWGFQKEKLNIPTKAELEKVRASMGMNKIEVDNAGKRIRKTHPEVQIDLSSMGEGYTIDKLSQIMEADGITDYLVEFGGDMKIRGHKPGGEKWRIAVTRPVADPDAAPVPYRLATIEDENGVTLNTSGTYRRFFDHDGKSYSHILDPRTGYPVTHHLVSASVFGTDPRISDAWATTMLCLGPKEGAQVAEEQNLEVLLIEDEEGKLVDTESKQLALSKRVTFEKVN